MVMRMPFQEEDQPVKIGLTLPDAVQNPKSMGIELRAPVRLVRTPHKCPQPSGAYRRFIELRVHLLRGNGKRHRLQVAVAVNLIRIASREIGYHD